ncbi:PIN domain-containing protein [Mesorhizobium sp. M0924]|uniref:PIN domain-containing protein n=1 Tax=unclassified Mesorhizobium TaxID=325217 RepID=UPI00333D12D5
MKSPKKEVDEERMKTRHVFLDTQVYRALGHSPANPALQQLQALIQGGRVVLHITDITFAEVARQIREKVNSKNRELRAIEKELAIWRKRAPKGFPKGNFDFDTKEVTSALQNQFNEFILRECDAKHHQASHQTAEAVLIDYFDRRPPFDAPSSKEFPDAFALKALADWCSANDSHMYIVTEDKAFTNAALAEPELFFHLNSIHKVLDAAADLGAEGEQAVEQAINQPDFDTTFERRLGLELKDAHIVYMGDLAEGNAFDPRLLKIFSVEFEAVVALSDKLVVATMVAEAEVEVDLEYEDHSEGGYDSEDGVWHGAQTATIALAEPVKIRVMVEIDRNSGKVRDAKLIKRDIYMHHSLYEYQ